MDIEYKRSLDSNHLIIKGMPEIIGYENRMLLENDIPGLLNFSKLKSGDAYDYWYDISAKKSLKNYFLQEGITVESLKTCFYCLYDSVREIKKYLIDTRHLILNDNTVFFQQKEYGYEVYLVFAPGDILGEKSGLLEIAEYLIKNVNHEDTEVTQICYEIFEVSSRGEASIVDILEILDSKSVEIDYIKTLEEHEDININIFDDTERFDLNEIFEPTEKKKGFLRLFKRKRQKDKKNKKEVSDSDDFDIEYFEDDMEEFEEKTMFLSMDTTNNNRHLVAEKDSDNRYFVIDQNPYKIGSKEIINNAVLKDGVISRYHAQITKSDDIYYVEDLESKNGTFVNGQMLAYNEKRRLNIGDRISFANICFRFE